MRRDILLPEDIEQVNSLKAKDYNLNKSSTNTLRPKLGGHVDNSIAAVAPDSWNERLLKFIPAEAMGLYLAVDRAVYTSNLKDTNSTLFAVLLGLSLLLSIIFNVAYLKLIWNVGRVSQIIVSCAALVAYVYSIGGFFTPLGLSDPTLQVIVVILVAGFLIFFKPPEPLRPKS